MLCQKQWPSTQVKIISSCKASLDFRTHWNFCSHSVSIKRDRLLISYLLPCPMNALFHYSVPLLADTKFNFTYFNLSSAFLQAACLCVGTYKCHIQPCQGKGGVEMWQRALWNHSCSVSHSERHILEGLRYHFQTAYYLQR